MNHRICAFLSRIAGNRIRSLAFRVSRFFGDLPLRRKYLLSHIAVVLLSVAVLGPASYVIARQQVEKRFGEFSSVILQKSSIIWEARIKEMIDYFLVQFGSFDIGQKLKEVSTENPALKRVRIEKPLSDMITYRKGIRFIFIETVNGEKYFAQREDLSYSLKNIRGRVDVDSVKELRAKPFIETISDGTILLSKVVYDLQTTEYMGILTVGFDYDLFSIVFPDEKYANLGHVVIVDRIFNHPVLVSKGGETLMDSFFPASSPDDLLYEHQKWKRKDFLIERLRSDDGRWELQSYIHIQDVANLSLYAGIYIVLAGSLALAAAFSVSIILSRRESKRISAIKDYAKQIAGGDLSGRSLDNHVDELGMLSGTLEDLSHRIAGLVEGLASERVQLEEARYDALQFEYSALQSKINPHFLYNTLEMINAMAKIRGEFEISEMIQLIGEMMRDSLRRSDALISLKEEVAYIAKYLQIQNLLHEDNLKITLDIPDELNGISVPNFILQPIVENAITHGIEPLSRPGEIFLSAVREGDSLILCVKDNGVGMSRDKIQAVMNPGTNAETHLKIGLSSVDRRIRIMYDRSSGVKIESTPDTGTSVYLILPIQSGR